MPKDGEESILHWKFFLFLKETSLTFTLDYTPRPGIGNLAVDELELFCETSQFKLESWTVHTGYQIQTDGTVPGKSLTESRKEKQIHLTENGW